MSSTMAIWSFLLFAAAPAGGAGEFFVIEVVDAETGRGVPLVELETVHAVHYITDSAGIAAFREPGLMDQSVFFTVRSHGYEFPADGFGIRGKAFRVTPGGSARLEIRRINIAERLYRVTGGGIYRDSVLAGRPVPLKRPVLSGLVLGQDSIFNMIHDGKLYWFWGDTARPGYPLGNFHMSGATSLLPRDGGLDPEKGIDLTYFVDENGFSRAMARMPGDGPTWCDAFVAFADEDGREKMYTAYAKVRQDMSVHDLGLAAFDDETQAFEKIASWPLDSPIRPSGHAFRRRIGGVEYIYFAAPYPLTRVRATLGDYCNPSAYEAYTCLEAGSRLEDQRLDRSEDGALRYAWKKGTPAVGVPDQDELVKAGKMEPGEALLLLREADSGKAVLAHAGSVYFNPYRARWVMIVCEQFGTSFLGETWFAEADTPLGPWVYARKVVTHEKYSFYNPKQHPEFAKEGGRIIFFEGTYTHTFSGNTERTPRYDYNQILYKLDLDDPRLILPVPVYRIPGRDGAAIFGTARDLDASGRRGSVIFFALDRPKDGAVPIRAGADPRPIFYGLPPDADPKPATAVPLYEHVSEDGARREYSTLQEPPAAGFRRAQAPLCLVWRNPRDPDAGWQALEPRGLARQPRRTVRWNNPDGPRVPGIEHASFRSPSMDVEVGYNVRLPDGYSAGDARYPVIYFLHGAGGNENSDAAGFSGLVARLEERKKAPPAICVFPNGGMSGYRDRPDAKIMGETMIVGELIPRIDRLYRTRADREGRVIAGFSMGGGGAIRLALKHPDLFSAAGSWAAALGSRGGNPPAELEPENLRRIAGRVRLFLVVGDKDMTYAGHAPLFRNLEETKFPFRRRILEGVPHNLGLYHEKTGEEMALFLTEGFRAE